MKKLNRLIKTLLALMFLFFVGACEEIPLMYEEESTPTEESVAGTQMEENDTQTEGDNTQTEEKDTPEENSPNQEPFKINPGFLTEIEKKMMSKSFEEALEKSVVYMINKDPSKWYYYNQLKKDTKNPNRVKMYEKLMILICSGGWIKGGDFPHQYEVVEYPGFFEDLNFAKLAVEYDHPEFFYIQLGIYYLSGLNGKQYITHEGYFDSYEDYQYHMELVKKGAEELVAGYPKNASIDRQIEFIYNQTAACYYLYGKTDMLNGHSAYGILTNRMGVCEGYSLAALYLAKLVNLKTTFTVAIGDIWFQGAPLAHAWNAYVNGKREWKEFDATHRISTNKTGQFIQYNALTRFYMDLSPHCRVKSSSQN